MRVASLLRSSAIAFVCFAVVPFSPSALAQDPATSNVVAPRPLITAPIDETQRTVLQGNTHPLARTQYDLGTAPATLPMNRMLLVLKRSPDQETVLHKLLDDQQDKSSPNYHKWLTPAQFGKQFGPTDDDMQKISAWLQSHGFQVGTTKGRTLLEFSGSASQVQEAFHTSIHKYVVNGAQHWANASDPSIPTALTPAVAGVLTLHNFLKKPQIRYSKRAVPAQSVPKRKPLVTFTENGQVIHALAPQDYATIYNINGAYSQGLTGSGVTIGVVGRTDIYSGGQDVSDFRNTAFGICCGNFNIIENGADPGDLGGGEEFEATLDSSWSGAIANNATIDLVVSASTNTSDGVDLSEFYIVENNLADVMTESFGSCEWFYSSAEALGVSQLAEQAAAQGISYFVSSMDSGAEGCDDPNSETVASGPVSANLLASSWYTTGVGGTMFNENGQDSRYWGSEPPVQESAISYIPENVWNESCAASTCGSGSANIWAGGGGASQFFGKPSWQAGTGVPDDNARDVPDVALTSAGHDPYLLCLDGSCVANSQGQFYVYFVWGTSAAAPSFAGIMALIDQEMARAGQTLRQGSPNYMLYNLANGESSSLSQCNASNTTTLPAGTCVFNDVTSGNNAVPGEVNYGLPTAQYQAGVGYDQASGLGSVNVWNLISAWSTATFTPTTTTLVLNNGSTAAIPHGTSVPVSIAVTPNSGNGTPTGEATLLTSTGQFGQTTMDLFTLGLGEANQSTRELPGGTYNVWAHYSGDSTFAASDSVPVSVTVTAEGSNTALSVLTFDSSGNQYNFTGGPYGSFVYLRADVSGQSGFGRPTGTVTFSDTFGAIPGGGSFALNGGNPPITGTIDGSNTATPNGIVNFDAGQHSITATYSGDTSFHSSSSPAINFTITPGFYALIPSAQAAVVISKPGQSGSTSVSVSSSTGFSGTISLACSGLPSEASCNISPSSITATGTPNTTTATITVTTTAATAQMRSESRLLLAQAFCGLGLLFSMVLTGKRRLSRVLGMLLLLVLVVTIPACGGGGSSTPPPPPPNAGTPTGSYSITVTATSGATVSSTGFSLIVQ